MNFSYWRPDGAHPECEACFRPFSLTVRRHHCRDCGGVFCHACSSKAVIMFHRASPTTKVRICKFCAPYVEAKLTMKMEEERAASADRHGMFNETFVKSFQNRTRRELAPEDTVHAGYVLNRILQKNEAMFLGGNDLFVRSRNGATDDEDDDEDDDDAPTKTLRAERLEDVDVTRFLQSSYKEAPPPFPLPSGQDCMSILFDTASLSIAPSFQRLKDSLHSAHHVAINAEPQELPAVAQPMFYY